MRKTIIYLASDHAGFDYKEKIKLYLKKKYNYTIKDLGTYSKESTNYAIYGKKLGEAISKDSTSKGIVICGSGIGISIAANRCKGARAARVSTVKWAKLSRQHNDANILAIGQRVIPLWHAKFIVKAFLNTKFLGGRHLKRVQTLDKEFR